MPKPEFLDPAEFQCAQATMGLIGSLSRNIDWSAYVATVNHAETVAPFLDPTAWIHSPHTARELTTEMARLLAKYQELYKQCEAELRGVLEKAGQEALDDAR